jgi:DNA-binding LacI/PurR family transcriptional regulator
MPLGEMAERSVDSLLQLVAGRRVGDVVVRTPPALVMRASTGPPRS